MKYLTIFVTSNYRLKYLFADLCALRFKSLCDFEIFRVTGKTCFSDFKSGKWEISCLYKMLRKITIFPNIWYLSAHVFCCIGRGADKIEDNLYLCTEESQSNIFV